jgi:hypothetical protein
VYVYFFTYALLAGFKFFATAPVQVARLKIGGMLLQFLPALLLSLAATVSSSSLLSLADRILLTELLSLELAPIQHLFQFSEFAPVCHGGIILCCE